MTDSIHRPRRAGRKFAWAAVGGLVAALVAPLAVNPASAEPTPRPQDNTMGSTIREHEGAPKKLPSPGAETMQSTQGIDVSHWQGSINWNSVAGSNVEFVWMKATEGTSYTDDRFDANYVNSYNAGLIRGAYHFALPDRSSGAAQARFFVNNGGNWSGDGQTLPGALDIEYNPYGANCYGLSQSAMRNWIRDFMDTTKSLSGRYPAIYTTADWWSTCTGNWSGATDSALWLARWASSPGTIPGGWSTQTVWQYTDSGSVPGISGGVDRNEFNGSKARLKAYATCPEEDPC